MELDAGGSYRSLSAVDVSPIVPRWVRGSFGVTGVTGYTGESAPDAELRRISLKDGWI